VFHSRDSCKLTTPRRRESRPLSENSFSVLIPAQYHFYPKHPERHQLTQISPITQSPLISLFVLILRVPLLLLDQFICAYSRAPFWWVLICAYSRAPFWWVLICSYSQSPPALLDQFICAYSRASFWWVLTCGTLRVHQCYLISLFVLILRVHQRYLISLFVLFSGLPWVFTCGTLRVHQRYLISLFVLFSGLPWVFTCGTPRVPLRSYLCYYQGSQLVVVLPRSSQWSYSRVTPGLPRVSQLSLTIDK
jgi:hypothetical protein